MHEQPDYLARMSRSSHNVVAIMELGAQVAAETTASAAAVLVRQSGRVRIGALHDGNATRRDVVAAALEAVALDGPESPFSACPGVRAERDPGNRRAGVQRCAAGVGTRAGSAGDRRPGDHPPDQPGTGPWACWSPCD